MNMAAQTQEAGALLPAQPAPPAAVASAGSSNNWASKRSRKRKRPFAPSVPATHPTIVAAQKARALATDPLPKRPPDRPKKLPIKFLPFEQALAIVRTSGCQTQSEWRVWCKSGNRPVNIPCNPDDTYYSSGWRGFGHWLGTEGRPKSQFRPYPSARKFAMALVLKSQDEWERWCVANPGDLPGDIPKVAHIVYRNRGWQDYAHFLGLVDQAGTAAPLAALPTTLLPFHQAASFVKSQNLSNRAEFQAWCATPARPSTIPTQPDVAYKGSGWVDFEHFLGTGAETSTSTAPRAQSSVHRATHAAAAPALLKTPARLQAHASGPGSALAPHPVDLHALARARFGRVHLASVRSMRARKPDLPIMRATGQVPAEGSTRGTSPPCDVYARGHTSHAVSADRAAEYAAQNPANEPPPESTRTSHTTGQPQGQSSRERAPETPHPQPWERQRVVAPAHARDNDGDAGAPPPAPLTTVSADAVPATTADVEGAGAKEVAAVVADAVEVVAGGEHNRTAREAQVHERQTKTTAPSRKQPHKRKAYTPRKRRKGQATKQAGRAEPTAQRPDRAVVPTAGAPHGQPTVLVVGSVTVTALKAHATKRSRGSKRALAPASPSHGKASGKRTKKSARSSRSQGAGNAARGQRKQGVVVEPVQTRSPKDLSSTTIDERIVFFSSSTDAL